MPQSRPRIGVTRWEDVPGEPIEQYWEQVRNAGGDPVDLNSDAPDPKRLDGLMLTGGFDVGPERYGAEPHPKTRVAEKARDDYETSLLVDALSRDLAVLAICRGQQLLNVALGGGLLQHIDGGDHRADYRSEGYPSRWHTVRLEPESRLRELLVADEVEVNSRHHQAVLQETLAPGLTAAALSPDGFVEAIESRAHGWVVGVQWHPERLEPEHPGFAASSRRLFEVLVCQARRSRKER